MTENIAWTLSSLGQLSILLEVSSPKPGNVNRLRRFSDTGYRHFLASASMIGRGFHEAARKGTMLPKGEIPSDSIGIGELIHTCVNDSLRGLNNRNTIFGTILLYVPLVIAIAAAVEENGKFTIDSTRDWLRAILDQTTVEDTLHVYRAFHLIRPSGDLNRKESSWTDIHDRYDIENPRIFENIEEDQITLHHLFTLSADVDPICREWAEYYRIVFDEVFPYLDGKSNKLDDLEEGIVHTFIWLLSKYPDGLITRKAGSEKAEEVRLLAERVISGIPGSLASSQALTILEEELGKERNSLNPGTTADLLSAAILCKLASMTFALY